MSKITVNEYAKKYQISRQTVYNNVKNGLLDTIEENGKILIYDEDTKVSNSSQIDCKDILQKLYKRIDKLEKQNNKLNKKIIAEVDKREVVYSQFINQVLLTEKPKKKKKKKK